MYKILLLLLLLPIGSLFGQSQTSWKVYELFSNENIPLGTKDIQQYLPGYSTFQINTNDKNSTLHAIIDPQAKVNALIFSSHDYQDKLTRLVIPTPHSEPAMISSYLENRAFKLSQQQKKELLELISGFSKDFFSDTKQSRLDPLTRHCSV